MDKRELIVERLMKRSDEMKGTLVDIAGGACTSASSSDTSCNTSSAGNRRVSADNSSVQCLMAPKSGKSQTGCMKSAKRSTPQALLEDADRKHKRR